MTWQRRDDVSECGMTWVRAGMTWQGRDDVSAKDARKWWSRWGVARAPGMTDRSAEARRGHPAAWIS